MFKKLYEYYTRLFDLVFGKKKEEEVSEKE